MANKRLCVEGAIEEKTTSLGKYNDRNAEMFIWYFKQMNNNFTKLNMRLYENSIETENNFK